MDGVLIVDKPAGLTSHDVVNRVRHLVGTRRVGHTGTLDPFATGVLVVLVGRAARLSQFVTGLEKEYEAIIRLGYRTDTGDRTGNRIDEPNARSTPLTREEILAAMASLTGEIQQVPPMYSAKKKGGKKLYEIARSGEEVEREPVNVCIYNFEPLQTTGELIKDNLDGTYDLEVRVECSSGTYVRTLAEDFGKRLNTGAHVAELRRTRVGDFNIDQARTLERLKMNIAEQAAGRVLLPPDLAVARLPLVELTAEETARVIHGLNVKRSDPSWLPDQRVRLRDAEGTLIAIGVYEASELTVHPAVVLSPGD